MKQYSSFIFFVFWAMLSSLHAQESVYLDGIFKGKDLYVQNPFAPDGVGFCIYNVKVNGQVTSDEVNSSAFVVDLQQYELNDGDKVEVILEHKVGCSPEFINPEAIFPDPTFEVTESNLAEDGLLSWSTRNESGSLPFSIEQFKWNKWVKVGEVIGKGKSPAQYGFQTELHFGENKFRLYQGMDRESRRYSDLIIANSNRPARIDITTEKIRTEIRFSGPTSYEIFDEYGSLVKRGNNKSIDVSSLQKGTYYLNYADVTGYTFKLR